MYLSVEVCEFKIEEAAGQAAETEVGTQASRTGQQRVGIHSWSFKICNPSLEKCE